jgi:hypothetical protein
MGISMRLANFTTDFAEIQLAETFIEISLSSGYQAYWFIKQPGFHRSIN